MQNIVAKSETCPDFSAIRIVALLCSNIYNIPSKLNEQYLSYPLSRAPLRLANWFELTREVQPQALGFPTQLMPDGLDSCGHYATTGLKLVIRGNDI